MDPKPVIILGSTNGGSGEPQPIAVLPTSPNAIVVSAPTGFLDGIPASGTVTADVGRFLFVPAPAAGTGTALLTNAGLFALDENSSLPVQLFAGEDNVDGDTVNGSGILITLADMRAFNGTTYDRVRIANVFKTAFVTAVGPTPIWTPAVGKRFRLMGYTIDVAGTAAATGTQRIELLDAAAIIRNHLAAVIQTPTASISGGADHMGADLGQGELSAAANNVLNVTLSFAMATGGVAINVWGTEE
jgi:hypothetical protein